MLFTKGAESAILPHATGGEIEKTRLHVDEFALVRYIFLLIYSFFHSFNFCDASVTVCLSQHLILPHFAF